VTIFHPTDEKTVTTAIVSTFAAEFNDYVESDVLIVGGGPSGLVAGRELKSRGRKVMIIERYNYLGGGFWSGGYFMNKLTVRAPAQKYLVELGVTCLECSEGL
jgi:sulfide-dependent adenosine diphosphate thiazole synthase